MGISLYPATKSEAPLIQKLAEKIWKVHYTPIIGIEQVEYMLGEMYSVESISSQIKDGHHFYLIYFGELPIGYVSVSKNEVGEYFLNKFYIDVEQQGKGIGKMVFNMLLSLFPDLKVMRLQVNRMNYKTVNFYFRLGFVIELAKNFEIGNGYFMDDYVMIFKR